MLDLERRRLARAAQKEKFEQLRINAFDELLQARPCVELREMRQHRESGPEIRSRECPICDKHSCRTQRANEDRKPVSTAVRPTARRRTEMKPDRSFKAKERRRQEKQRAWLSKRLGSNLAVLEQTQLECSTANGAPPCYGSIQHIGREGTNRAGERALYLDGFTVGVQHEGTPQGEHKTTWP